MRNAVVSSRLAEVVLVVGDKAEAVGLRVWSVSQFCERLNQDGVRHRVLFLVERGLLFEATLHRPQLGLRARLHYSSLLEQLFDEGEDPGRVPKPGEPL